MIERFGWLGIAVLLGLFSLQSYRLVEAHADLARKDTEIAQLKRSISDETLKQERKYRAIERDKAVEAERITHAADEGASTLRAAVARGDRVIGGLRDEIARLNARPAPEDPRAAAFALEASAARELFGSCAAEYRSLGDEAEGLRLQVGGLQDFAVNVGGAGK